ncbi:MAG: hypothetical protein JO296_14625 [Pseudonocardiales bacterium]|jgi:hypothetical protein|nr:hypothetical protein [Pseudonocardiales bacterium]MBV9651356.1 hypothetical protein [Pseudonocardiales bacterium]
MAPTQKIVSGTGHRPATAIRRARFALSMVFFCHGVLFASWTPYIPGIKSTLGLSDASLGVAVLGAPAGSVGGDARGRRSDISLGRLPWGWWPFCVW